MVVVCHDPRMQAFYSDQFVLPLPEGHRFPSPSTRMLRDRIAEELPSIQLTEAPAATEGELALVHTPASVEIPFFRVPPSPPCCAKSAFPGAPPWPNAPCAR